MNGLDFDFRSWIRQQKLEEGIELKECSNDHFQLVSQYGLAEIKFYPDEIVEISITRKKDNEVKYYLHFQLHDEEHTKRLFFEMIEALASLKNDHPVKVLLSCSSGFTTSYFVEKLKEAAKALDLDYEFRAISYFELYDHADQYDIVLIAPQIGYLLKKIEASLPDQLVEQIPTALFASYDVQGMLEFIQKTYASYIEKNENRSLLAKKSDCAHCLDHQKTILAIAELFDGKQVNVYTRLYRQGEILLDDVVIKPDFQSISLADLIHYALSKCETIDQVAMALPGMVKEDGIVDFPQRGLHAYPMKKMIQEEFDLPSLIVNNANVCALGYQVQHPEYKNVTFFSQPNGVPNGGQGNVVNGTLCIGTKGIAGETKFFLNRMQFSDEPRKLAKTDLGTLEIITNALLPTIALLGPEIVVIRAPLLHDLSMLRKRLASFLPEDSIPKFEQVQDVRPLIFDGLIKMVENEIKTADR